MLKYLFNWFYSRPSNRRGKRNEPIKAARVCEHTNSKVNFVIDVVVGDVELFATFKNSRSNIRRDHSV